MKRTSIFIIAATSVLMGLLACQKEQPQAEVTPEVTPVDVKEGTFTLTVQASKDPTTKALALVDGVFTATWASGETVTVYNASRKEHLGGTLSPKNPGNATTFLSGTLTGTINAEDWLELWFYADPDNGHKGQDGSLPNLGNHEIAMASLQVESISNGVIVPKSAVTFSNQQSIVKFTLQNKANDAAILANTVTIWAASKQLDGAANDAVDSELKINPSGASEIYVALQNKSGEADTYAIIATDGSGNKYVCRQSGATFEYGKYYEITLKMTEEPYYRLVGEPAAVFGEAWNTSLVANNMVMLPDGTYKKNFTITSFSSLNENIQFKVFKNADYSQGQWPSSNYSTDALGKGEMTIYFNPYTNSVSHDFSYTAEYRLFVYPEILSCISTDWGSSFSVWGGSESFNYPQLEDVGNYKCFMIPDYLVDGSSVRDIYFKSSNSNDVNVCFPNITFYSGTKNYYYRTDGLRYVAVPDPSNPAALDSTPRIWIRTNYDISPLTVYTYDGDKQKGSAWPGDALTQFATARDYDNWYYVNIPEGTSSFILVSYTGNNENWRIEKVNAITDASSSYYYDLYYYDDAHHLNAKE